MSALNMWFLSELFGRASKWVPPNGWNGTHSMGGEFKFLGTADAIDDLRFHLPVPEGVVKIFHLGSDATASKVGSTPSRCGFFVCPDSDGTLSRVPTVVGMRLPLGVGITPLEIIPTPTPSLSQTRRMRKRSVPLASLLRWRADNISLRHLYK